MRLTDSQKRRINRYMRDVSDQLGELDEDARRDALVRLRRRLERDFGQFGDVALDDADVEGVLEACGSPSEQADYLAGKPKPRPQTTPRLEEGVWLGICATLARRFDLPPYGVRIIAVLLGLIPPFLPIVMLAYVAAYAVLRYTEPDADAPPIDRMALAKALGAPFGLLLALYIGSEALMSLIRRVVWRLFDEAVALSGNWGWLDARGGGLFYWLLLSLLPLAAISALTPDESWKSTLHKIVYAVIALYALALCFGLACYLVGVILQFIDAAGEIGPLPTVF